MNEVHLVLYTFGVFRERADSPVNQGFHDRNDPILEAAEVSEGFVARSGYEDEPGPEQWGEQVFPHFYVERGDGWAPSTLSLWRDLESVMAFSYGGLHGEALRHGREWFVEPAWPPYALWWVTAGETPNWKDAVRRHLHLHHQGPSPLAFTFKHPLDAEGNFTVIDRAAVKRLQTRNQKHFLHSP